MPPHNVAVLDDYQGLSPSSFKHLADSVKITQFKDTLPAYNGPQTTDADKTKLVERLQPFEIICSMRERTPFPRELFEKLPNLKVLLTTGVRNLAIDLTAARENGVIVAGALGSGRTDQPPSEATKWKGKGVDSTTQHAVTLILGIARNIASDDKAVKEGKWQTTTNTSLAGKTLGVVGLGRLGVNTAKIMHLAFGMRIIAWSENLTQEAASEKAQKAGLSSVDGEEVFKAVGKEELFRTADVISVHYLLSDRSRGIVAKKDLELMKPSAFFVNTSRGPLVVESDLLEILKQGKIRGAALDVFDIEPLPLNSPWRFNWGQDGTSQVLLTPHSAYVEVTVLRNWYDEQAENIERLLAGQKLNNIMT